MGSDTTRYRYDALGNILEVSLPAGTRIEYVVDAENRRVGRKVDGRLVQGFLWEGALRPVAEVDSAGAVVARFIYGERPNVPEYMTRGGRTYRLVQDHLGSVRLVVEVSTGEVAQRIDYDAFGQVMQNTRPGFQPFGYAGGLYDERTGLVRFGARDYDAKTGRWTAKDPASFAGGDSNLFGYVFADPVNNHDPKGTYTIAGFVTAQGGGAALAQKVVINFASGCGTSVAASLAGSATTGNNVSGAQLRKDCMINGALSVIGFLGGNYASGAMAQAMKNDRQMRTIFRGFGAYRDDVFDMLSACLLSGLQSTYNEVGGYVTGAPLHGEDVLVGQAVGCISAATDKLLSEHPVAAAIYGALLGSTAEFVLSYRDALDAAP